MKRNSLVIAAVAAAAIAPAAATAHGNGAANRAHKLHAKLTAVRADVAAYGGMSGKGDLTTNKRNAKSSVHLKGMVPGTTYTWAVVQGTDAATVCSSGTPLANWKYRSLHAGKHGNANSHGHAKHNTFKYDSTATYAIVVYQAGTTNEVLLCGVLHPKSKHSKHAKSKGHGKGV